MKTKILFCSISLLISINFSRNSLLSQELTPNLQKIKYIDLSMNENNFITKDLSKLPSLITKNEIGDTLIIKVIDSQNNPLFKACVYAWIEGERPYDFQTDTTDIYGSVKFNIKSYKQYGAKAEKSAAGNLSNSNAYNIEFDEKIIDTLTIICNNPILPDKSFLGFIVSLFDKDKKEITNKKKITLGIKGKKDLSIPIQSGKSSTSCILPEGKYSIIAINSYGSLFYDNKLKKYIKLKSDYYITNTDSMNLKPGYKFFVDLVYERTDKIAVKDVERPGGISSKSSTSIGIPALAASKLKLTGLGFAFESSFVSPRAAIRLLALADLKSLDKNDEDDFQVLLINVGPSYHFYHFYKFHFFISGGIGYEYFKRLNYTSKSLSTSVTTGVQFRYFHLLGGTQELFIQLTQFPTGNLDLAILLGFSGTIQIPIPVPF